MLSSLKFLLTMSFKLYVNFRCMEMTFSTLKDRQTAEEELPKWKPSLKLAQAKGTSKGIGISIFKIYESAIFQ